MKMSCPSRMKSKKKNLNGDGVEIKIEFVEVSPQYRPGKPKFVTRPDLFLIVSCLEVSAYVYFCYKKVSHIYLFRGKLFLLQSLFSN